MNSVCPSTFLHSLHTARPFRQYSASRPRPSIVRAASQDGGEEQAAEVCPTCGISNASKPKGCDGQGRIAGGLGAVVGWFPIKAYRPCPAAVKGNFAYTRKGQITDEVLFGKGKQKR
ncbi:hypothetical protein ABBQ32_009511 [Trebouxia sp. C0010 RCD-2024]